MSTRTGSFSQQHRNQAHGSVWQHLWDSPFLCKRHSAWWVKSLWEAVSLSWYGTNPKGCPAQPLPSSGFCFPKVSAFEEIIQCGPKGVCFEKKQWDKRNFWRGLWSEDPKQHHGDDIFLEGNHWAPDTGLPKLAKCPCAPNAMWKLQSC